MKIKACVLGLLLAVCAAGCGPEPYTHFKGTESSLSRCLVMLENTIKRETGRMRPYSSWEIWTNKPDEVHGSVWGNTSASEYFSCHLKRFPSGRTYWQGTVNVPDRLRTNPTGRTDFENDTR